MHPSFHRYRSLSAAAWRRLATVSVYVLIGFRAFGLDPHQSLTQYAHSVWRIQDGLFSGAPRAFAQTTDGYIWIGTQAGLMRFDGVNFTAFRPSAKERLRSPDITSLLAAKDGSLWIGTGAYLAHYKDGDLTNYLDVTGQISEIRETQAGDVWFSRQKVADNGGALCRVVGLKINCYGETKGMPYRVAGPLLQGNAEDWWIATAKEVAHWNNGSATRYAPPGLEANDGLVGFTSLAKSPDGTVWAGMMIPGSGLGLQHLASDRWDPLVASGIDSSHLAVTALLFDQNHSLWIGTTDHGIYRLSGGKFDHFGLSDGLSSDTVAHLFEDRERNIWVATTKGIDKFRETKVVTYSKTEGLSADEVNSVLPARDGTVWLGDGALDSIRDGKMSSLNSRSGLPGKEVTSLLEDDLGKLWVGVDDKLFVRVQGRFEEIRGPSGHSVGAVEKLSNGLDGSVWARSIARPYKLLHIVNYKIVDEAQAPGGLSQRAFVPEANGKLLVSLDGGDLAEYDGGQWRVIPLHRPKSTGTVIQFASAADGRFVGASSSGVVGWKQGRVQDLNSNNGLPCSRVHSLVFDLQKTLWLYSACGLLAIADSELDRWWQNPKVKIKFRTFDILDGAQPAPPDFQPQSSMSPDGKLWFANGNVLQQIDPLHLSTNMVVPPVHIEGIIADKKEYPKRKDLSLPALTRELQIDYTALSFVIPQRVQFRYRLEGWETEWQDAGVRRQAFYTNLRPGPYRFHVIACNDDGLWNDVGDAVDFTIAPAYYQTRWFEFLCVAVFAALLWILYLLRLKQATAQIQERLGARLEERERIARELHDTLLQGFQGLMLRLQAVMKTLPAEEPAHQIIESVLDRADQVLLEGRQSVRDLRENGAGGNELSGALARCGEELAEDKASLFSLSVVGTPRSLGPVVFNEVHRIGREALTNAFQHSQAKKIELELTYADAQVSLRIRDDGAGIDPAILGAGRPGHWGLSGMRERAQKIGAQLNVWSKPGAGTEIELTIPAKVAYPQEGKESLWQRIRRRLRKPVED